MRRLPLLATTAVLAIGATAVTTQLVSGQSTAEETVFVPVTPCRLIDTRPEFNIGPRNTPIGPDTTATFNAHQGNDADSTCNIPTTATAISTNVTAVNPTAPSFLTLWPANTTQPNTSNLNYGPGAPPTPNAVNLPLAPNGTFNTYNLNGTIDVIIDINGYYQPSTNLGTTGPTGPEGPAGPQGPAGPEGPAGQVGPIQPQISTDQIAQLQWWAGARTDYPTGSNPRGVAYDGTNIWITNDGSNTVSKMNPTTGTRTDYPTGSNPRGVAYDGTNIWITNDGSNTVSKMNPTTGTRTDYPTGSNPRGVAYDGTNIWITNFGSGTVSKMNTVADTDATTRWAKIDADSTGATILHSAGATATSRIGTGLYVVEFDGPINTCAWTATLNDNTTGAASNGQIAVEQRDSTNITDLTVSTFSETGTLEDPADDDGFSVVVTC